MTAGPRILAVGESAVLVEPTVTGSEAPGEPAHSEAGDEAAPGARGVAAVLQLHAALEASRPIGVIDLVPAHATVLVTFDTQVTGPTDVAAWIRRTPPVRSEAVAGDVVEVPVRYDGADLEEVGRLTGLGADGVVAAHTEGTWTVAFTGFAPGFGYLVPSSEDARLDVPRRATPRVRVPAGAVALAAGYTGVYPRPSPGGWQLIGTTSAVLWDSGREPPALLHPGARVAFRAIGDTSGRAAQEAQEA